MDLKSMILGGAGEEQAVEQRLSKEEYAAMKKQQNGKYGELERKRRKRN